MIWLKKNHLFGIKQQLTHVWTYFQAYTSVGKAALILKDHIDLAKHMNTICFHTKMVDYLDQLVVETSDLSLYWWVKLGINCILFEVLPP